MSLRYTLYPATSELLGIQFSVTECFLFCAAATAEFAFVALNHTPHNAQATTTAIPVKIFTREEIRVCRRTRTAHTNNTTQQIPPRAKTANQKVVRGSGSNAGRPA